ncbi:lipid II flippase MurJ [Ramlibacter tataouinensis]|uniref:lipid II flippase MurJ n=1 Tax=Ramlibacter tataouinensis TaxID=94132 RepID=UPI0022F39B60|nr:lipid II flippase MurJ [Ramlibacter tataouinensis]WBY00895.1 lipid II flippase MurJ [Ramlibacter tataouinensis]
MFLRAGALSLALLLASRLLGVVRESALAAAFGSSGLADLAVLALTLPDWIASVLASGALAYVLLPAWAGQAPGHVAALQRRVAIGLLAGALALTLALGLLRHPLAAWLAGGVPAALQPLAAQALWWSALAVPAALLSALWVTRLQHERDFAGMYGANLVVNAALIGAIAAAGLSGSAASAVTALGLGLLAAMGLRLLWLRWRHPAAAPAAPMATPAAPLWLWAMLAAGLPLALPFAARSIASQAGEGALATFNYAWKLVELPLVLAIQLVASLAFPSIAQAFADGRLRDAAPLRQGFALAWTLACAAVAALVIGGPALAQLLFGWGRMQPQALAQVAHWGVSGSWGLLPQALAAVALTALAAQRRMRPAVAAYAAALLLLLAAAAMGVADGFVLMQVLNAGHALVALACLLAIGPQARRALPWALFARSGAMLLAVLLLDRWLGFGGAAAALQLLAAALAALAIVLLTLWRSAELRQALRR